MTSPDLTPYVDLSLYDKDPQDLVEAALLDALTKLPEWQPREGNIEIVLIEALALEVAELIYSLNRVPDAIAEAMFKLYGVERDLGAAPKLTLRFEVSDRNGHDLPPGTRVKLNLQSGLEPVVFTTDVGLAITAGQNFGVVAATGSRLTNEANGATPGTPMELLDAVVFVERVLISTAALGGRGPETDGQWFDRATTKLTRLTETLVLPQHFVSAALERVEVARAFAVDNYDPNPLPVPVLNPATSTNAGGVLAAGTVRTYQVTAVNAAGETTGSNTVTITVPAGNNNNVVNLSWSRVQNATSYSVYGASGAAARRLIRSGVGTVIMIDNGANDAGGPTVPAANTTVGVPGSVQGFVTLYVYGYAGFLTAAQRDAIAANFELRTAANLGTFVADPVVTPVNVTCTVRVLQGFVPLTVRSDVIDVIRVYLNPQTWNWDEILRRNELIAIISSVDGVAFVEAMTVPAGDVVLPGVATLASTGVVNVTALQLDA